MGEKAATLPLHFSCPPVVKNIYQILSSFYLKRRFRQKFDLKYDFAGKAGKYDFVGLCPSRFIQKI